MISRTILTLTLMLVGAGTAFAKIEVEGEDVTLTDVVGAWVRVGDGCRMLSEQELMNLGASGGGNTSRRSMTLTMTEDRFQARFQPSLRCEKEFEKREAVEFGNKGVSAACEPPIVREGEMTLNGSDLSLVSQTCDDDKKNPWGCSLLPWIVKKIGGALVIRSPIDNDVCDQTPFYIYFIPVPLS